MSLCCLWTQISKKRCKLWNRVLSLWWKEVDKLREKNSVKSQGQACSSGCCGTCTILTTRLNLTLIGKMYHKFMTKWITVGNDWIRLEKWENVSHGSSHFCFHECQAIGPFSPRSKADKTTGAFAMCFAIKLKPYYFTIFLAKLERRQRHHPN